MRILLHTEPVTLRIAVSFGTRITHLASLLSSQRAQEPQTHVRFHEVALSEQLHGLENGQYDGGLALTDSSAPWQTYRALPLWQDELVIALPEQSPLLRFEAVPLMEIAPLQLLRWSSPECEPISSLIDNLFKKSPRPSKAIYVGSFELMMMLVAAGSGIGFGPRSRLDWTRMTNVTTRPLAGSDHILTTSFLHPCDGICPAAARLMRRAQTLAQ